MQIITHIQLSPSFLSFSLSHSISKTMSALVIVIASIADVSSELIPTHEPTNHSSIRDKTIEMIPHTLSQIGNCHCFPC